MESQTCEEEEGLDRGLDHTLVVELDHGTYGGLDLDLDHGAVAGLDCGAEAETECGVEAKTMKDQVDVVEPMEMESTKAEPAEERTSSA